MDSCQRFHLTHELRRKLSYKEISKIKQIYKIIMIAEMNLFNRCKTSFFHCREGKSIELPWNRTYLHIYRKEIFVLPSVFYKYLLSLQARKITQRQ